MFQGIVELCQMAYQYCQPGIINIPTNSILTTIPDKVRRIAESCPKSRLIINLSLDGIGAKHDYIRGVPGNFVKFEQRLKELLELRDSLPNLTLGIHSVISTFSVGHLDELMEYADQSGVDQFITEIAEPRVELDTVGLPITPDKKSYTKAINKLIDHVNNRPYKGISKITEAFRVQYYKLVKRILDTEDQVIPCYAGWASGHIYGDGTVWPCCVRADNLGNLRDHNYDFGAIWFGQKIKEVRRSIAAKECHCPLANASYTNLLHDLPTLARVGMKVLMPDLKGKSAGPKATPSSPQAAPAEMGAPLENHV
jgi:MoaA/NifB/PqqE/SkfB family radical SAM enzyme